MNRRNNLLKKLVIIEQNAYFCFRSNQTRSSVLYITPPSTLPFHWENIPTSLFTLRSVERALVRQSHNFNSESSEKHASRAIQTTCWCCHVTACRMQWTLTSSVVTEWWKSRPKYITSHERPKYARSDSVILKSFGIKNWSAKSFWSEEGLRECG